MAVVTDLVRVFEELGGALVSLIAVLADEDGPRYSEEMERRLLVVVERSDELAEIASDEVSAREWEAP